VLLTIAGMLQFKPVFLGQAPRRHARATTTQKCVRTNDVENVGVTARHHTFFEMLGAFSFGDYFKREAAAYAWELTTQVLGIPAGRVWVSVYEQDGEAEAIWRDEVGVPAERIRRMGAEDNFWASGPTGPCGPCSELYYDFHPERGSGPGVSLDDDSRFIEFYNLVFMELNRSADGSLQPLAAKCIDTGMGLERVAQILQRADNNYETDLMMPILRRAAALAGVADYRSAAPQQKAALKVIGDHARAITYLLSDGVLPSNVGRGYVLRRLARRAVMKARLLGVREPVLVACAREAVALSVGCDPAVAKNAERVYEELEREEAAFLATLAKGQGLLDDKLKAAAEAAGAAAGRQGGGVLSGADAFLLYDSFGFPLELTQELAEAAGVEVDVAAFEVAMEEQRRRSKEDSLGRRADLTAGAALAALVDECGVAPTEFCGYDALEVSGAKVAAVLVGGRPVDAVSRAELQRAAEAVASSAAAAAAAVAVAAEQGEAAASSSNSVVGSEPAADAEVTVVLDRTPFYAESGGQVGDRGTLVVNGLVLDVLDVTKAAGGRLFVHRCALSSGSGGGGDAVRVGDAAVARVDTSARRSARAHHTATHLLQSALKRVLGEAVCQQGSLVAFDRLRFDFNLPRAMTPDEVSRVERMVNGWIAQARPTDTRVMGLEEARAAGALAMFGEKYDDQVRVVRVGGPSDGEHDDAEGEPGASAPSSSSSSSSSPSPSVSMELCGGTHVRNTSEIGAFKVVSEAGVASGVRRVEAVCGSAAVAYLDAADGALRRLAGGLKVAPLEVPARVESLQEQLRAANKAADELRAQLAVAKASALAAKAEAAGGGALLVAELEGGAEAKALAEAAASLLKQLEDNGSPAAAVLLGAATPDGAKVNFAAAFSAAAVKERGLQAGKVVGQVAKVCGGGGGGKPAQAQAGGRDASKLGEALALARDVIGKAFEGSGAA
jgi:alanyl-tRNA synthetase